MNENKSNNKMVKKYIRRVKWLYLGRHRYKNQFIPELRDALLCFLDEHPDADYAHLLQEFGKPSDIKGNLPFSNAKKLHNLRRFLYCVISMVSISVIVFMLMFAIRSISGYIKISQGYFIENFEDDEYNNDNDKNDTDKHKNDTDKNGNDKNNSDSINPFTGEPDPPLEFHEYFE